MRSASCGLLTRIYSFYFKGPGSIPSMGCVFQTSLLFKIYYAPSMGTKNGRDKHERKDGPSAGVSYFDNRETRDFPHFFPILVVYRGKTTNLVKSENESKF